MSSVQTPVDSGIMEAGRLSADSLCHDGFLEVRSEAFPWLLQSQHERERQKGKAEEIGKQANLNTPSDN